LRSTDAGEGPNTEVKRNRSRKAPLVLRLLAAGDDAPEPGRPHPHFSTMRDARFIGSYRAIGMVSGVSMLAKGDVTTPQSLPLQRVRAPGIRWHLISYTKQIDL